MQIMLAPMEGIVDDVMRDILTRIGGIDVCVTEFIRVTDQLHPPRTFRRMAPELAQGARTRAGTPLHVQLLGSDPQRMAQNALLAVAAGARVVDVNFGCPAPTVNKHRGGAALLKEPELMRTIVGTIRQALPAHVPVTAKMRLGYEDTSLTLECADALVAGGAAQLVVHARTKVDGYRPPAHWEWLDVIRRHVSVPVVANGEVWTLDDYRAIRAASGCDTVMIGRGLLAAPDLARRIRQHNLGEPVSAPMSWADLLPWIDDFYAQCCGKAGASSGFASSRLKQWLKQLARHYPEAAALFERVRRLNAVAELRAVLDEEIRTWHS